jgi:hypothetical protein
MNTQAAAVTTRGVIWLARDRKLVVMEHVSDDTAGKTVDDHGDRAIRSIADSAAPRGGPAYTGRA